MLLFEDFSTLGMKKFPYLKTGPFGNPIFFVSAVMNMKETWVPAKVSRNLKLIFHLGILAQAKMTVLSLMSIRECKLPAEGVPVLLFTGERKNCLMTKS